MSIEIMSVTVMFHTAVLAQRNLEEGLHCLARVQQRAEAMNGRPCSLSLSHAEPEGRFGISGWRATFDVTPLGGGS